MGFIKWRKICEFPDYMVSNTGIVAGPKKILKPIRHTTGYFYVNLYKDGKPKAVSLSRLVARAFVPNPLNKPNVDHIDRDLNNNNADNLRWVTQSENLRNENTVKHRSVMFGNQKAVDVAANNGIPKETFYRRIRAGWSVYDACHLPQHKYKKASW